MSEQNILNPAQTSLFNPDWNYTEGLPETRSLFQTQSGKLYARRQFGRGRTYELAWNARDLATKHALQQWERQYENDFFSLADWERGRYFSGRFEGPLTYNPVGNQQYNIKGRFIELPGLAMFAYPANWARDAIFLEERNGFGEDLVKLLGAGWGAFTLDSNFHGGGRYTSGNLTTADSAEWVYFGYGFRFWNGKDFNRGIGQLSCIRARDGVVVLAATNVDQYAASTQASAVLFTKSDLPLDFYRVKYQSTNTRNPANVSAAQFIEADAIEVMQ